ncbi:MAG TPA: tRNA threonylcarbamoyladenosine dehydratase [Bacteroidales bacterium]|jgi:tRNA A37 threonylcarbamoyladenosine dehydratase|nr:tRNA threonylcarbamoyladenosine dehydratase [Bacteroidales bacterium]
MDKWLSRTGMLIGKEALEKLRESDVLVVGLGGVGAYAAEMICRAGIGRMTVADGDVVHTTNRNRQLLALRETEGMSKAALMGHRLREINPSIELTVIDEYLKDERMVEILDKGFDYVVDAIDTLSPKLFLIYHSVQRKIPVVSSMGAGGKFDPLQVSVSDISQTTNCPLARILRKRLHRLGIREGITAVYSPETVDKSKVVSSKGEPNKASTVGTISYMPALFGIACASVVIRDLAGISR